ncbi:MAG: hypothetical protein ACQEP1_02295 [Nanobdellota archaeon]
MALNNREKMDVLLNVVLEVGSQATSKDYMEHIIKQTLEKEEVEAFKYMSIEDGENGKVMKVREDINSLDQDKIAESVDKIINTISKPCAQGSGENIFMFLLKGYLGKYLTKIFKDIGVKSI